MGQKIVIDNIKPLEKGKFIKTKMIEATRADGKKIQWEMADFKDSVHILVENTETNKIVLVQQPRVPVIIKNPETNGEVYEACAGIIDKDCSIEQIAVEEVLEELGYKVDLENLIPVRTYMSSVGSQGSTCYSFFCKVTNKDKVSEGGGLPEEDITVIELSYTEVLDLIEGNIGGKFIDSTTLFLLTRWLLTNGQFKV